MRKPTFNKSVRNAFRGVYFMLAEERNFQLEVLAFATNIVLIFLLNVGKTDAAILLLTAFVVLIAEAVNTAIEKICDFIHPEFDARIGLIKDIAAGAAVLAVIASLIVAAIIYPTYL